MSKISFCFLFSVIVFLVMIYQNITSNVLWRHKILDNTYNIIYYGSNLSLKENIVLKNANCRKALLKSISMSLNKKLLKLLTESCFEKQQKRTDSILKKGFIKQFFGNVSCRETIPTFLNESRPLVALASFPGSGNTWSRHLLETITGIHTSTPSGRYLTKNTSKRCPSDPGFLILKTHGSSIHFSSVGCPKVIVFSRAIFILRNPYDAFLAEYNRLNVHGMKVADRIEFSKNNWSLFVERKSKRWKQMALFWLTTVNIPVHVLVYEDLKVNTMLETYRMMNFLNLNVTLRQLFCLVNKPGTKYYRGNKPKWLTKTKLFKSNMKKLVNSDIKSVYLKIVNTSRTANILKSYILSDPKLLSRL